MYNQWYIDCVPSLSLLQIYNAWLNARQNQIWNINSYAMSNHLEYWAEATGVYFNVNHHPSSSGGMNGFVHQHDS